MESTFKKLATHLTREEKLKYISEGMSQPNLSPHRINFTKKLGFNCLAINFSPHFE